MFTGRLSGASRVTSRPRSSIRPPVGGSNPPIIRSVVVLPQPLGPSSEKNSPVSIAKRDPVDRDDVPKAFLEVDEANLREGGFRETH